MNNNPMEAWVDTDAHTSAATMRWLQDEFESLPSSREDKRAADVDQIVQLVIALGFAIIFCAAICVSIYGRQIVPMSNIDSENLSFEERFKRAEARRRYVSKSLVVKHVIPKEEKNTPSPPPDDDDSTTHNDEEELDEEEEYESGSTARSLSSFSSSLEIPAGDDDENTTDAEEEEISQQQAGDQESSSSPRHTTYRRLKSNLILSDSVVEDMESAREPMMCMICLTPYELEEEICWSLNPACLHVFHRECIEEWLLKHDNCPCCRNDYLVREKIVNKDASNGDE